MGPYHQFDHPPCQPGGLPLFPDIPVLPLPTSSGIIPTLSMGRSVRPSAELCGLMSFLEVVRGSQRRDLEGERGAKTLCLR